MSPVELLTHSTKEGKSFPAKIHLQSVIELHLKWLFNSLLHESKGMDKHENLNNKEVNSRGLLPLRHVRLGFFNTRLLYSQPSEFGTYR